VPNDEQLLADRHSIACRRISRDEGEIDMKSGGIFEFSFLLSVAHSVARRLRGADALPNTPLTFGENLLWQARRALAGSEGGCTAMRKSLQIWLPLVGACLMPALGSAQVFQGGGSFRVQCPTATIRHPGTTATGTGSTGIVVNLTPDTAEVPYTGPVVRTVTQGPTIDANTGNPHTFSPALTITDSGGAIKCQQISGGDGMMTEADGNQTFMYSFGPLSGLGKIRNGQPGTDFAAVFNSPYTAGPNYVNGQPNPLYVNGTSPNDPIAVGANSAITDPAAIMNSGVIDGNIPAPLMAFDEDDEYFLTLTNVGMIMRPDLFEQHTVHFHGYPNASSFYDGVPDASIAINIGGSFTYYYLAPDAGTYFWHCHITPPEHLQMGMVGQLFVRPRQNRTPAGTDVYQTSLAQQKDLRTACNPKLPANPATTPGSDILCSVPLPAKDVGFAQGKDPSGNAYKYVYNDGDGSTRYDIDVPIQIHGFDPNFHFVGMTFNPEGFSDMKDKYFLLNGRSYPDTVGVAGGPADVLGQLASATNPDPITHAISTTDTDTLSRPSQPLPALITLNSKGGPSGVCGQLVCGQRAALRIADLDVQEYQTLSSVGIPMLLIGFNAKILRDQAGNNLYITTNSITLGGGESLDVILDSTGVAPGTYFLYTPQLDHLSNDAENFGGLMTEVVVL
jgi:FtsP/CotA-like multicopper oxidase with cupredoxin domain